MTLPPFPSRGDRAGWSSWWAAWRDLGRQARVAESLANLVPEDWPGDHVILDLPEGVSLLAEAVDEALSRAPRRQEGAR